MAVLAGPIVALAFQSGEFGPESAHSVSLALWAYLLGLPLAAVDLSLINAFYARQNTRGPAAVGALSVLVYLLAAAALGPPLALLGAGQDRLIVGLALADSVKHAAHVLMMVALLARAGQWGALDGVSGSALRALAAAVLMALAVAWLDRTLAAGWVAAGKAGWAARCLVGVAVGAPVYLWVAARLGVEEIRWALDLARQRLPRRA
jgi:putative peptidoglycan lipid II flippase